MTTKNRIMVGDYVEVLPTSFWYGHLTSNKGIVICRDERVSNGRSIGIRFDEKIRGALGHELGGVLTERKDWGYGYWIDEDDLEIIKSRKGGNYYAY